MLPPKMNAAQNKSRNQSRTILVENVWGIVSLGNTEVDQQNEKSKRE